MFDCCCDMLSQRLVCVFFKQKTAYEMRISDWSSDVCSSDLRIVHHLLDRVRVESARRDDDEAQRVADQMDERLVLEQFRILLKDRRTGRVLDMRFDRDRPFGDRKSTRLNSSH